MRLNYVNVKLMNSQKGKKERWRHAGLDSAFCIFNYFWIPAWAGMTGIGLFAVLLKLLKMDIYIGVEFCHFKGFCMSFK